ncbi:MAG: hypothetical protein G01um101430_426 [Parcubacteria group bacterium Gr01-1014_30]|nr:MAG: hypothetical protein G01um101430_426 [Parcubacteria group bacterium Gr01-1014_30]
MEKQIVIQKLNQALNELYKRDFVLIENKTEEETIIAQLIAYLRPLFDSWNVDPEYNRDGRETKRDSAGNQIFPDILIHHRTPDREERYSPENNLATAEVKGYWNTEDRSKDTRKLLDMRKHYGYQYLFRIELGKDAGKLIEV